MKKFIVITAALIALMATGVFAQDAGGVRISGSTSGYFLPVTVEAVGEDDPKVYTGTEWWLFRTKAPYVGITVSANTDKLGFSADFWSNSSPYKATHNGPLTFPGSNETFFWGIGNAWAEAKPVNGVALRYGRFGFFDLMGKVGTDGAWSFYSLSGISGNSIFTWVMTDDYNDVLLTLNPIQPLLIAVYINNSTGLNEESQWVYQKIQAGAGYTIDNIGQFRVQYIGDYDHIQRDKSSMPTPPPLPEPQTIAFNDVHERRIEAAFALTMIENITVDLGGKFFLPIMGKFEGTEIEYSLMNPVEVALGASVNMGSLGLLANVDMKFAGENKYTADGSKVTVTKPFGMALHLTPSYDLGFLKVGGDIGWTMNSPEIQKIGDGDPTDPPVKHDLGFGLFAELPLGSGFIGIGAGLSITGIDDQDEPAKRITTTFNLPIVISYFF